MRKFIFLLLVLLACLGVVAATPPVAFNTGVAQSLTSVTLHPGWNPVAFEHPRLTAHLQQQPPHPIR